LLKTSLFYMAYKLLNNCWDCLSNTIDTHSTRIL